MSETQPNLSVGTAAETVAESGPSFLDQVVAATKQTEPDRAQELVKTLVAEALAGTVTFDRNLHLTIEKAIKATDAKISAQLNAIMHHPRFSKLEGSWRGLRYLVQNTRTGESIKLRVMNASKRELVRDLDRAVEFDQSQLFKKIYESEFGTAGGQPFGALVGDYEWTNHPEDVETLRLVSQVAAGAFAPFISAAGAAMFGFDDWTELPRDRDLAAIFDGQEYTKWNAFRQTEDSRFVTLVLPRTLARLPYGHSTKPVEEFDFEEAPSSADGRARKMGHNDYCWTNAAYVLGERMAAAFFDTGFCTAIRGAEGGGKVENLPYHTFVSADGDEDAQCPTEVSMTDRREFELSNLGFLPLVHYKNQDNAVFMGAQTVQKPRKMDRPAATENAAISARLPYLMATSRFAHYLKVIARDKIGSFQQASDMEALLNRWIRNYVNANPTAGQESKARYPLRDAKIEVLEIPGRPGSYNAVAHLQPWLQLEELTTSMRLVARMPSKA